MKLMTNLKNILFTACAALLTQGCHMTADRGISTDGARHFFADRQIDRRVDSVMRLMTLDEKIGQLVLYSSHFTTTGPTLPKNVEEAIRNGTCGNIFNAHVPEYNRELQRVAVEETRMHIPLLFGYDVIHGMKTIFPINLGMSCSWDLQGIENSARVAAREAIASGLNWTFSPMVDITRDPRWGRVSEGSGEDTYLGSLIAIAMVQGYQGTTPEALASDTTILACVKHFAAYGAPEAGRDYNTVDLTDRTLRETYLPPYKAAVDAGVGTVMAAFNDIDAVPAHASQYLMQQILRKEWGFNGFVVSDFTGINELVPHGVAADSSLAGQLAIEAGINMDLQGDVYHRFLKRLGHGSAETGRHHVRRSAAREIRARSFRRSVQIPRPASSRKRILQTGKPRSGPRHGLQVDGAAEKRQGSAADRRREKDRVDRTVRRRPARPARIVVRTGTSRQGRFDSYRT